MKCPVDYAKAPPACASLPPNRQAERRLSPLSGPTIWVPNVWFYPLTFFSYSAPKQPCAHTGEPEREGIGGHTLHAAGAVRAAPASRRWRSPPPRNIARRDACTRRPILSGSSRSCILEQRGDGGVAPSPKLAETRRPDHLRSHIPRGRRGCANFSFGKT